MHCILELRLTSRDLHPNYEGLPVCFLFFKLVLAVTVETKPVVFGLGIFLTTDLNSHISQPFTRAKTWVGVTLL
jgi:hypothetical protein